MQKQESGKIKYHYGFYGAIQLEFTIRNADMEYHQEYQLGKEPVRLDMLIINKQTSALTDPIGSFFKTYNVLEYKSPEDSLTIDDFYKVQAYALFYKASGNHVDEIPINEMTASLFRHL